jgi:hypothetical protein
MDETILQKEKEYSDLVSSAKEAGLTKKEARYGSRNGQTYIAQYKDLGTVDEQAVNAIYQKYKKSPDFFESGDEELEKFAKSIGQTKD